MPVHIQVRLLTCCQEMVLIHKLVAGSAVCVAVLSRLKVFASLDQGQSQLHATAAEGLQHCMRVAIGVGLQFVFY